MTGDFGSRLRQDLAMMGPAFLRFLAFRESFTLTSCDRFVRNIEIRPTIFACAATKPAGASIHLIRLFHLGEVGGKLDNKQFASEDGIICA